MVRAHHHCHRPVGKRHVRADRGELLGRVVPIAEPRTNDDARVADGQTHLCHEVHIGSSGGQLHVDGECRRHEQRIDAVVDAAKIVLDAVRTAKVRVADAARRTREQGKRTHNRRGLPLAAARGRARQAEVETVGVGDFMCSRNAVKRIRKARDAVGRSHGALICAG